MKKINNSRYYEVMKAVLKNYHPLIKKDSYIIDITDFSYLKKKNPRNLKDMVGITNVKFKDIIIADIEVFEKDLDKSKNIVVVDNIRKIGKDVYFEQNKCFALNEEYLYPGLIEPYDNLFDKFSGIKIDVHKSKCIHDLNSILYDILTWEHLFDFENYFCLYELDKEILVDMYNLKFSVLTQ